tara:strand:+ start:2633 stop:4042 length:1410 start_codon:yes stop_codon:yes gene_type:complete
MMNARKTYFFCGIGGSGMMPLSVLLNKTGAHVIGSDRSYDQGKTPEKFQSLKDIGIEICPQDGSGINDAVNVLVVSSAVEESIPDVRAALDLNIPIIKRGALLAECFNTAKHKIAVAGTSGKSTVTGMIGTILFELGEDPTIVNGGEIRNLKAHEADRFSNIRKGRDDLFVAEMDESDGSIAHYNPSIAVLNNVALDHKSMEELEQLFGDYLVRSSDAVIVNYDQPRVRQLCEQNADGISRMISYAIDNESAALVARSLKPKHDGIDFDLHIGDQHYDVHLNVIGRHNVENALAALGVCVAMGLDIAKSVKALAAFNGIHRRMEYVGTKNDITVMDDFAHNPDKISASLQALKTFDGRLIVMFQPHGYGPLRLMGQEMVSVFAGVLDENDILLMPEVYYAGGTVDRSVTAKHLIEDLKKAGVQAHWFEMRNHIPAFIDANAARGDRIIIMGARDDTLHTFARDILNHLP